jgi:hypothetical protein
MSQSAPPRTDFAHLPVTFSSYLNEQLRGWDTLFPAERSYLERLSRYLEKAPASMFEGLEAIEKKMGVTPEKWPRGRFTLEQVDFLNRNPHYQEWRAEIARLFSRIDPVLEAEVTARGRPRVVIVISPAELPVGPDRMWTRLAGAGGRVPLTVPDELDHFLPLLLSGHVDPSQGRFLGTLAAERPPYAVWAIETGESLGALCRESRAVHLSYARLDAYRHRLMAEVQKIVEDPAVKGPRQLSERLKTLKVRPAESELAADGLLSEFVRTTLLAGNGTLLINNTFVEWASVQALRRARPDVLLVGFGIRNKVKPFSSLLIFHDQDKATAIPSQADMLGSWVDLEIFYQYIWQEAAKQAEYRNNTAYVFAAIGMDELHLIAPLDFPLEPTVPGARRSLLEVHQAIRTWLG